MSYFSHPLNHLLSSRHPFWQAPLPFELIPSAFSAQISASGAVGVMRLAEYHQVQDIKALPGKWDYAFSHRIPRPQRSPKQRQEALQQLEDALQRYEKQEGKKLNIKQGDDWLDLLEACLPHARSIGFMHGIPERDIIEKIKQNNVLVYAYCRNVLEALTAEHYGMDFVVLQGMEAGGERVGFPSDVESPLLSSMSLLQQCISVVRIPLVIWGDFSRSEQMVAALLCGAQGIMLDRPFLACRESALNLNQRQNVLQCNEYDCRLHTSFTTLPIRAYLPQSVHPRLHIQNEAFWLAALKLSERPLSMSLSAIEDPVDWSHYLNQQLQKMQQYLA